MRSLFILGLALCFLLLLGVASAQAQTCPTCPAAVPQLSLPGHPVSRLVYGVQAACSGNTCQVAPASATAVAGSYQTYSASASYSCSTASGFRPLRTAIANAKARRAAKSGGCRGCGG